MTMVNRHFDPVSFVTEKLRCLARESLAESQISRAAVLNACADHVERLEQANEKLERQIAELRTPAKKKTIHHSMPAPGSVTAKELEANYDTGNYGGD